MPADTSLYDLASAVLAALEAAYLAETVDLPDRRYVSDGIPAYDCEQVTVRVANVLPMEGDVGSSSSPAYLAVYQLMAVVEVDVVRCSPTLDDSGTPPSTADIEASALATLADAVMIPSMLSRAQRAGDLPRCDGVRFVSWAGAGPEGGFVGGTTTVHLLIS